MKSGAKSWFCKPAALLWSSAHCQIKLVLKMGFGHTCAIQLSRRGRDKPNNDIQYYFQLFEFSRQKWTKLHLVFGAKKFKNRRLPI